MLKHISNKVLIPAVAIIWLGVIYRIWGFKSVPAPIIPHAKEVNIKPSSFLDSLPPLSLSLAYKDPFQVKGNRSKRAVTDKNNHPQSARSFTAQHNNNTTDSVPKPSPAKPKFLGISKETDSSSPTAILSYQNKTFYVEKGDSVASFVIHKIYLDSIVIQGAKARFTIGRNE